MWTSLKLANQILFFQVLNKEFGDTTKNKQCIVSLPTEHVTETQKLSWCFAVGSQAKGTSHNL
jgi:hypothetical protein